MKNLTNLTEKELLQINGGDAGDAAYWIGYAIGKTLLYSIPFGFLYEEYS